MNKLVDLLNLGFDEVMLKDIACTFIQNGKIEVWVKTASYISEENIIDVIGYNVSHHLSKDEYEPLVEFFRENGFSFSDIEDYMPDYIFYYIYI